MYRRDSNIARRDQRGSRRYGNVGLLIPDRQIQSVLPVPQIPAIMRPCDP